MDFCEKEVYSYLPFFISENVMQENQVVKVFGEHNSATDKRVESFGILTEHAIKIARFCYQKRNLLILRAPKASTIKFRESNPCGWRNDIAAKPVFVRKKTHGGLNRGFYSDYDIVSYWQYTNNGYKRLETGSTKPQFLQIEGGFRVQHANAETGNYLTRVPIALLELAMATGISEFRHGANDEYLDERGRPKKHLSNERFVVFDQDGLIHLIPESPP